MAYAVQIDSENNISWLFPSECHAVLLPRGIHWVPREDRWIELDEVRGQEEILVFTSTQRSEWLERNCPRFRSPALDRPASGAELRPSGRRDLIRALRGYLEGEKTAGHATLVRVTFVHE